MMMTGADVVGARHGWMDGWVVECNSPASLNLERKECLTLSASISTAIITSESRQKSNHHSAERLW